MDPVSVVGVIGASIGVAKLIADCSVSLASFVKHAPHVADAVKDLSSELQGLQGALSAVGTSLERFRSLRGMAEDSEAIRDVLDTSINYCKLAAVKLDIILSPLQRRASGTGALRRAVAQVQLNMDMQDIRDLRSQAQAHKLDILTSLQVLTM